MVSISADTFRVLVQQGSKYSLGYYPDTDGKATRFFVVSLLWSKNNTRRLIILAHETHASFVTGRKPRRNFDAVNKNKLRLALYHAVRKWEEKFGINQR